MTAMVNTEEMKNLNYEQVYAEAEKCMNALEGTEVGLEEALALHARGKALLEICQEKLEAAKQRLEVRAPVAVDSDIVV